MKELSSFIHTMANGEIIPKDLELLVRSTDSGDTSPFDELGLRALSPGEENEVNNHSYMTKEEFDNPDIQSNIEAIKYVARMATFVAQDEERNIYGYWRGKSKRLLNSAPIIKYDNEGQFSILPGATLAEAVAADYCAGDEDAFSDLKVKFAEEAIEFSADDYDSLYEMFEDIDDDPSDIHQSAYNSERAARGLPELT